MDTGVVVRGIRTVPVEVGRRGAGRRARSLPFGGQIVHRCCRVFVRRLSGVCQATGTVIVSETAPSSSSVIVASPKVTSVMVGVH